MRGGLEPCVCVWSREQAPPADLGEPSCLESAKERVGLGQESPGRVGRKLGGTCVHVRGDRM